MHNRTQVRSHRALAPARHFPLPSPPLSCSLYVPPNRRQTTLSHTLPTQEPESPADRTARHLRMCRRLAELGMDLAEDAAAEARTKAPAAPPSAETPPEQDPRPTSHPAIRFARLAASVRQAIALERRIVAAQAEAAHPNRHRREALRPALHHAAPPERRREIDIALDSALADPHSPDCLWDIHTALCQTFGLTLDYSTYPAAELLELRPEWMVDRPPKEAVLFLKKKDQKTFASWWVNIRSGLEPDAAGQKVIPGR